MSLFDIIIHTQKLPYEYNNHNFNSYIELFNYMAKDITKFDAIDNTNIVTSWMHLVTG